MKLMLDGPEYPIEEYLQLFDELVEKSKSESEQAINHPAPCGADPLTAL